MMTLPGLARAAARLPKCALSPDTFEVRKLVYLSLGSNLGDRAVNISTALDHLATVGEVKTVSSFYETEPVDFAAQPWFVNCAVALETELMPRQLLGRLQAIEQKMGRRRTHAKGPRLIDIDILLFGTSVIDHPDLIVPHPELHERRFVLEPLVEIAPDVRHPIFKKSMRQLCEALPPGQSVRRMAK